MTTRTSTWDGDIDNARALQVQLAAQVSTKDRFHAPLRTVAGLAATFDAHGAAMQAAVVLLDAETLELLEHRVVRQAADRPCPPDLASFRELPALLQAFSGLSKTPDLVLVDGHGIAHPQRLGIAAHFGAVADVPSIGVGRTITTGEVAMALHEMRGAFVPLREAREQIGWLLRSKVECPPLVVSPGHRVAMPSAAQLVMRCVASDRLPEPIRQAAWLIAREHASQASPAHASTASSSHLG